MIIQIILLNSKIQIMAFKQNINQEQYKRNKVSTNQLIKDTSNKCIKILIKMKRVSSKLPKILDIIIFNTNLNVLIMGTRKLMIKEEMRTT